MDAEKLQKLIAGFEQIAEAQRSLAEECGVRPYNLVDFHGEIALIDLIRVVKECKDRVDNLFHWTANERMLVAAHFKAERCYVALVAKVD